MSYCVDIVSEDSFYENLVLGLTKLLESHWRVSNVIVERRWPVDKITLSSWEQKHSVALPDDLRQFYLSTDGFRLKWSFQYSTDEILPVGLLNINTLSDLTLTPKLKELLDKLIKNGNTNDKVPHIASKSKIFELDDCKETGKICLVFFDNNWSIWLLEYDGTWTYLANSFIKYFRMALVHQALPRWQAVFTKKGLIPWAELFLLMAPHLLQKIEKNTVTSTNNTEVSYNQIDPSIFKVPVKHTSRGTNPK